MPQPLYRKSRGKTPALAYAKAGTKSFIPKYGDFSLAVKFALIPCTKFNEFPYILDMHI